ncbi:condensin complex subunit 2-like [Pyrus x bretschneideri]|uniref:condensin complex subunit 2-like n=1 Tax=Pyrus x bretschneideri TaxID=225117 RepID=UPI00202E3042|nr:condensin complex subunit 2-like [Pyrus x bretschneideri]
MAYTRSPNLATQKQRLPMAARLQPPTSPFFLGCNDDHSERAQARAARAAAIGRKSVALNLLPAGRPRSRPRKGADPRAIRELHQTGN